MVFTLLYTPCFAAIGAMNAEIKQKKWLLGGLGLQLGVGYTLGFLVYQIGTLITTGSFGAGFLGGLIAIALFVSVILGIIAKTDKEMAKAKALKGKK